MARRSFGAVFEILDVIGDNAYKVTTVAWVKLHCLVSRRVTKGICPEITRRYDSEYRFTRCYNLKALKLLYSNLLPREPYRLLVSAMDLVE